MAHPGVTFKVSAHPAKKYIPKYIPNYGRSKKSDPKPAETKRDIIMGNLESEHERVGNRNGFVGAITEAYNHHHNLTLRPDDVWMAIMTQFSFYLEKYGEDLRAKFVDHEGKKELKVTAYGSLFHAPYDEMARMMSTKIAENIKDPSVRDWVLPNFTTTTLADKVVGSVVLMASMKKFFSYKMRLMCGIPNVTLLGTVDDWKQIVERARRLIEFDKEGKMVEWSQLLLPVLGQFVRSAEGNPDIDWWQHVCSYFSQGSGTEYLSGWITVFCVFKDNGEWVGSSLTREGKYSSACSYAPKGWPLLDTNDLPPGIVNVDVLVDDNGTEYQCEMTAGHRSFDVKEHLSIQPRLEWDIHLKKEQPKYDRNNRPEPWEEDAEL